MEFRVLGPLEVTIGDEPLPLGPPKQRALLALLLLSANEVVPREAAIDALWSERPPTRAANALQVYVHGLRSVLGHDRIVLRGTGYSIRTETDELDLARFEQLLVQARDALAVDDPARAARRLEAALELWRGPPLADLSLDSLGEAERGRLTELRLRALELQADAQLARGRHEDVVPVLEALVVEHPLRERFRAQLMLALYRAGRQADALDVFRATRKTLLDEVGLEPSPTLRELERAILRQDPSLTPARRRPELRLPELRTALIGRALDIVSASARLRDADSRLLTLTGPGGVGKTRLAIEVAAELGSQLTDGASFVDLAPVADPGQVVNAIAAALDVAEEDRRPTIETVVDALRSRELVLLLDNFERLLAAGDVVRQLLDAVPRIRILVTSRTPLRLAGEQEYAVEPLDTPPEAASFETLTRNDSVAVFVTRAQAADRTFQLDDQNAGDVAAICRALDGLPLALELAAARVKVLSPAQMRDRVERPLAVLTGGGRDLPARHQTLRATIDWSYDLLDESERRLFAELSVFAGGCTLEAAEEVCRAEIETLSALLDNGLLRRLQIGDGEPRFRMLSVVRDYAAERLERFDPDEVRRRHAQYYARFADRLGPELLGPETAAATRRVAREHDNLRAALAYAFTHEPELGFLIVAPLRRYLTGSARGRDVTAWLADALAGGSNEPTPARVGALVVLGRQHMLAGRYDESRTAFEQAVRGARRLERWSEAAAALGYLAWLAAAAADYAESKRLGDDAVVVARRGADMWAERQGLVMVAGALINLDRPDAARPYLDRSLELARRLDDPPTVSTALVNSGYGAICSGDLDRARTELERALEISREPDQPVSVVSALQPLAWQANAAGERERARALVIEALELLREDGGHSHRVDVLTEAAVTLSETAPTESARLLGAAEAGARAAGMRYSTPQARRVEALRQHLGERLGSDVLAGLLTEGSSLNLDDAVRAAHEALTGGGA